MSYDIRPMSRADLDMALGWAREEGWNPGLDDATSFHTQDPGGFLMGWLDGEPISCISVVKYGASFAFLGLYIVRPTWRGQGHGLPIWNAGMARAAGRTIGLDGVVAQQGNYRRSGFALAHRNARWGGTVAGAADARVRPVTAGDMAAIAAFDTACFPEPRPAFLRAWLAASETRWSLCFVEGGAIAGWGTIRRCVEGYKIGPLFARSAEAALSLIEALSIHAESGIVHIDVPAPNETAAALVTELGFTPSFETARMYRGPAPAIELSAVFGITTLELG